MRRQKKAQQERKGRRGGGGGRGRGRKRKNRSPNRPNMKRREEGVSDDYYAD